MPAWTDEVQAWASSLSLFVAAISAWFVVLGLRQAASVLKAQNRSSDISAVLCIWERLDQHWTRFRKASDSEKNFEFGQLIGYYEMACSLFKDKVFETSAARTLYEHLREILPLMRENTEFSRLFDSLQSSEKTFENIRWFCAIANRND